MPLTIERHVVDGARACAAGLEALIRAIWPEAYRLALSILRDRGLAEDAAQESCAAIARSLPSLKDSGAFAAWSYRVIVSHALTAARSRPGTQSLEALPEAGIFADPNDALDLAGALASLSPLQRVVILLHYYAGFTSAEIAATVSLRPSTVRFHLMSARRALRAALLDTPSDDEVFTDVR